MDAVQEILGSIPADQLAAEVGTDPATAQQLAGQLIPALISGMSANAGDTAGARSLATALDQHTASPLTTGRVDLGQVDTGDGAAIVDNVFGAHTPQVTQRLGAQLAGGNNELVQKLLSYLAPIVLAYLAKQLTSGSGSAGGGILGDLLGSLTGGGAKSQTSSAPSLPNILLDMLKGGSRQAPDTPPTFDQPKVPAPGGSAPAPAQIPLDAPAPTPAAQGSGGGLLGDLLGGLLGGGRRS